ncbi:late embryogenesis abundant protein Dc3 [Artemisia annua]|uniref:Late embryogenesis abundant protein Dc3 n=1 Tax=Artemisia annua TaxID=35608 RepID=A0A2U1QI11_ARTAN|nr:late embryogenesis abundant protein Dc3 [Artemisia annua]
MLGNLKAGKDKTGGALQSTGETVMNYAKGGTENVKNTLGMGTPTTTKVARSTQDTAVAAKDKTGGVLQTTGDSVMNAAQGATESVKNTLGIK